MGKISISVRNSYGMNKLRGEDLSSEESIALIELAKAIILHGEAEAAPIVHSKWSHIGRPTVEDKPTVEDTITEPETTSLDTLMASESPGMSSVGDAIANAMATKFGTSTTSTEEDSSILSPEEHIELLNQNFHETGIKHKLYGGEIVPFYRVRWECPKCGDKGNHYGPENIKQMFCYNCNAALLVRPAAGKFPNRDDWGNFFLADELNMKFMRA